MTIVKYVMVRSEHVFHCWSLGYNPTHKLLPDVLLSAPPSCIAAPTGLSEYTEWDDIKAYVERYSCSSASGRKSALRCRFKSRTHERKSSVAVPVVVVKSPFPPLLGHTNVTLHQTLPPDGHRTNHPLSFTLIPDNIHQSLFYFRGTRSERML